MEQIVFETRNKSRKHQIFISREYFRIHGDSPIYLLEYIDHTGGVQLKRYQSFNRAKNAAIKLLESYREAATETKDKNLVKGLSIDFNRLILL